MKFFKWKVCINTSIVCLMPILLGISVWNKLPDTVPIHFNLQGIADNYASKSFVVFGLPVLMAALQGLWCFVNDISSYKNGIRKKVEKINKWIIPFLAITVQIVILSIGIGWDLDIRRVVSFIMGVIFIVTGNYMPKHNYLKNYHISRRTARKINRFTGYETVIMGLLFFVSIFLPPVSTVICLFLLIPYAIIGAVYGIIQSKR